MNGIYALKLHEAITVTVSVPSPMRTETLEYRVIRVHGGWLYVTDIDSTFVPFTGNPEGVVDNEGQLGNRENPDAEKSGDLSEFDWIDGLSPEKKEGLLKMLQERGY